MNHGNGGVALMGAIPSWEHPETMGYGKYPVAGIKSAHPYVDDFVPMKHKQPVRFGVSVCYALNERFGIESGLFLYLSFRQVFLLREKIIVIRYGNPYNT